MPRPAHPYLVFWGKAQPGGDAHHCWRSVAYHLLDVAATIEALQRERARAQRVGARLLGMEPDEVRRLVVAFAARHELGKFGRAFQAKVEALWPAEIP